MKTFKEYLSSLNEKTKLMKVFSKGKINVKDYEFKELKAGDELTQVEVLEYFGYTDESKSYNKIIQGLKYSRSRANIFSPYSMIDNVDKWLDEDQQYKIPSFLDDSKYTNEEIAEYYRQPVNRRQLMKVIRAVVSISKDHRSETIKKIEAETGINFHNIVSGLKWIERYRSKSGRAIDKSLYPFLKALTVGKKKPPKTVYRGIFMDGDKFNKMKPALQDTYVEGNEIKLSNTKATSWSTSKGVAIEFMTAQDKIKNEADGFGLLLSYDIKSEDDMIADFRVFPDNMFYNQQEILLDKSVKFGKIESLVKHGQEVSMKSAQRFGDSASSIVQNDYIQNLIQLNSFNLSADERIELKRVIPLNLEETLELYPTLLSRWRDSNEVIKLKGKLLIALAGAVEWPERVISPTKALIKQINRPCSEHSLRFIKDEDLIKLILANVTSYTTHSSIELTKNSASGFRFLFELQSVDVRLRSDSILEEDEVGDMIHEAILSSRDKQRLESLINTPWQFNSKTVNYKII